MILNYEAFTRNGRKVYGTIQADNKEEAEKKLYKEDLILNRIIRSGNFFSGARVKNQEIIHFTRLLATAVKARIPLVKSLEIILEELSAGSTLKYNILSIIGELKSGRNFSDALSINKKIFSHFYISMVRAGEKSGTLDSSLDYILKYLQKREETGKKVSMAMLYPALILSFAFVVLVFFIAVLIPRFQESYSHFGNTLPDLTLKLIQASGWIKDNFFLIIIVISIIYLLFRLAIRTAAGKSIYDRMILSIPLFGGLIRKDILSRLVRTLSTLLSNGITLKDSLELCGGVVKNEAFESSIKNALSDLTQGKSFTKALKENKLFPIMLVQLSAIGEESGRLPELLNNLSDFYENEVSISVEKLTSLLTPIMIIGIGIVIGFIVIALFLPIFNISEMVK